MEFIIISMLMLFNIFAFLCTDRIHFHRYRVVDSHGEIRPKVIYQDKILCVVYLLYFCLYFFFNSLNFNKIFSVKNTLRPCIAIPFILTKNRTDQETETTKFVGHFYILMLDGIEFIGLMFEVFCQNDSDSSARIILH